MTKSFPCPFAKAILNGHSRCKFSETFHISERHGVQCTQPSTQQLCAQLSSQLHHQSHFALGVTRIPKQITSNMELRIQCGGLNGLQQCTSREDETTDIATLIEMATEMFGAIDKMPYQQIIQSISQWAPKRRGRQLP
ncbi:MAG: hypothetical protein H8D24_07015 [Gammaproteobacteria bacterium]|uniref:Uncharacterized protein n=1 Tax=Candidatus Thiopontia autotrophica TaxID=2841688 RepID=A0A8J6TNR2_9GAMM|nr:hypothetical protein [Candidatus Thiopontia autotrophica]MBL6968858.1 hypothetical protein [Gammaproteobacteria bacterium]